MTTSRRSFHENGFSRNGVLGQGLNLTLTKNLFAKTTGEPIIIGHQCDLTGGISSWGYWHDKAAKAAVDYLNDNNGIAGRPVKYVVEDTETNRAHGGAQVPLLGATFQGRLRHRFGALRHQPGDGANRQRTEDDIHPARHGGGD